jgi:hypothetical protein
MAIAAMAALAGQMPSGGNNEQIMRQLQAYMTQMKSAGGVGGKKG